MCIIFYHWVCISMFEGHLIEYVCWWEFVCELSETFHVLYSSYCIFWERDEWPSLRSSGPLSFPSLRSLLIWLHSMSDLSWSLLLFMLFVLSLSSFSLLIHYFHFTSYSFLTATHLRFDTLFASSLHITISSFCFICLLINIIFKLGILRSMAHGIYYTCCISYVGAWVLIIGYLSLVFLHFYYPITLPYVMSRVLRPPWGHDIMHRVLIALMWAILGIGWRAFWLW